MEKECKFSYNEIDDSLIISCNENNEEAFNNFLLDDLVFHLNKNGKILGLTILNASGILNESGIDSNILDNIKSVDLNIIPKRNSLFIAIDILSKKGHSKFPLGRVFVPKLNQINLSA